MGNIGMHPLLGLVLAVATSLLMAGFIYGIAAKIRGEPEAEGGAYIVMSAGMVLVVLVALSGPPSIRWIGYVPAILSPVTAATAFVGFTGRYSE